MQSKIKAELEKLVNDTMMLENFPMQRDMKIDQSLHSILQVIEGEIIKPYKDYIEALTNELDEVVPMAHVHGWRSSRYEQGKEMRAKIAKIKSKMRGE